MPFIARRGLVWACACFALGRSSSPSCASEDMLPTGGAVIFLHGSGDTGPGVRGWLSQLGFVRAFEGAGMSVETPSATPRPYKLAGGRVMSIWYDRNGLPPSAKEHLESVEASCEELEGIVNKLVASGTPARRIVLGGFSMGGASECFPLRSLPRKHVECLWRPASRQLWAPTADS